MSENKQVNLEPCPLCQGAPRKAFNSRDLLYNLAIDYDYASCAECACVYQTPMPSEKTIQSFYPDEYAVYQPISRKPRIGNWEKAVLQHRYSYQHLQVSFVYKLFAPLLAMIAYKDSIPFSNSVRLLDIGCGNGKFMNSMTALGWDCEGVEFSDTAIQECEKQSLKVFHGDVHAAEFDADTFDVVSIRHVIEHIPDPNIFLKEISRILKPGGRLVVKTPNSQALGRGYFGVFWFANDVPRHLVLFSPENLAEAAARQQLAAITQTCFTTPKIILNSWDYKTNNQGKPSKRKALPRLLAKAYVFLANVSGRGDEIFTIFRKTKSSS